MPKPAANSEVVVAMSIVLVGPPTGVSFCLQSGRHDLVEIARSEGEDLRFPFTVRAQPGASSDAPRLLGPFTQGPPAARFVYVCSGTLAGDAISCWTRRAKIPLRSISWDLIQAAVGKPGAYLEARVRGTSRDGGPCCATVPLLDGGWVLRS